MGRHFVSHGKLGKSGQVIKAVGNGNLTGFPDDTMNIEQNHKTETEENQLFAFPQNIQQLMVRSSIRKLPIFLKITLRKVERWQNQKSVKFRLGIHGSRLRHRTISATIKNPLQHQTVSDSFGQFQT